MTILSKILGYSKILGINIVVHNDGYRAFYCQLNKVKGQVSIDSFGNIENIEEFEFDKNIPIAVNICGKGVLTKKITANIDSISEALSIVLPNANEEDFYTQLLQDDTSFCSIARKNTIDDMLGKTSFFNNIISLSFDSLSLLNINFLLNNQNSPILSGTTAVHIQENTIQTIEPNNETCNYTIDNFLLNSFELVAFATAFQNFENSTAIKVESAFNDNESDFFYKTIFDNSIRIVPVFFLVILLANFVLMMHLENKYDFFNAQIFSNQKILDEIEQLNTEVSSKESFLKNEDWFSTSMVSFYADRIAFFLPNEFNLTSLNIYPSKIENNITKDKFTFNYNSIELNAYTSNAILVTEWVKTMKKENWVKDIEIIEYTQSEIKGFIAFKVNILIE